MQLALQIDITECVSPFLLGVVCTRLWLYCITIDEGYYRITGTVSGLYSIISSIPPLVSLLSLISSLVSLLFLFFLFLQFWTGGNSSFLIPPIFHLLKAQRVTCPRFLSSGGKGCVCVFVLPNSHLPLAAMYNSILGILVATKFNLLNPMDTASRLWNYLPTRPDWCLQNLPHRLVQRNVHPL